MPCPSVSNTNYPDYIKKILKQIDVVNNQQLKNCACQLKSPLSEEGCAILGPDNKAGIFNNCITEVTPYSYDLNLLTGSISDLMKLIWTVKNWKFSVIGSSNYSSVNISYNLTVNASFNLIDLYNISNQTQLVCSPTSLPPDFYGTYRERIYRNAGGLIKNFGESYKVRAVLSYNSTPKAFSLPLEQNPSNLALPFYLAVYFSPLESYNDYTIPIVALNQFSIGGSPPAEKNSTWKIIMGNKQWSGLGWNLINGGFNCAFEAVEYWPYN